LQYFFLFISVPDCFKRRLFSLAQKKMSFEQSIHVSKTYSSYLIPELKTAIYSTIFCPVLRSAVCRNRTSWSKLQKFNHPSQLSRALKNTEADENKISDGNEDEDGDDDNERLRLQEILLELGQIQTWLVKLIVIRAERELQVNLFCV
jgi:hypothetical protein